MQNTLKTQQKIDKIVATYKRLLEDYIEQGEDGTVSITTEIRIHQGGIRTSEIQEGFRFSV